MSPEQAGKFLYELLTSVPDGAITVTVSRSSLLPACSLKVSRQFATWRSEAPDMLLADDFASALDKLRDGP